jgi:hypothetical protein
MRALHGSAPHSQVSVFHAVPVCELARTPLRVCARRNENAVGSVRGVDTVTNPFASTVASHALAHLKDAARQLHPESQRTAQPFGVAVTTMLKEASGDE